MRIEFDQTLHGYENGHQLLESSRGLTSIEKRTLLVQSDLSGSDISSGFESYLTGYPIEESAIYVLSRTWYAHEMRRPGCVWTHSLLIKFQDLGKIPELRVLILLLERPTLNDYSTYNKKVIFENDINIIIDRKANSELKGFLLNSLYGNPEKIIIQPSLTSEAFEDIVLDLWSDQWPRLRRNFYFCTGALAPKTFEDRQFDLQIVPERNANSFMHRLRSTGLVVESSQIDPIWRVLEVSNKNTLRWFLWTFGSDIEGERKNYIPLLRIFNLINANDLRLTDLANEIISFFPNQNDATLLKVNLFGHDSILSNSFDELQLVEFLSCYDDISFLPFKNLNLSERLFNLNKDGRISFAELLRIWRDSKSERISGELLKNIRFETNDLIGTLENNLDLVESLGDRILGPAKEPAIWESSFELQKTILNSLIRSKKLDDWTPYIYSILESKSKIIFEARRQLGIDVILYSLDWLSVPSIKRSLLVEWAKAIVLGDEYYFNEWIKSNRKKLNISILKLILSFYDPLRIQKLNLSGTVWVNAYNEIKSFKNESDIVRISCVLLTVGLNNKLPGSNSIVIETFHHVYDFAAHSRIDYDSWRLIPKEDNDDEDESIFDFFPFFGSQSRRRKGEIPSWDYCEVLIRTLANRFIQNSWSNQSFVDVLCNKEMFLRTVEYCLGFTKGKKFVSKLANDNKKKRIKVKDYHNVILKKVDI